MSPRVNPQGAQLAVPTGHPVHTVQLFRRFSPCTALEKPHVISVDRLQNEGTAPTQRHTFAPRLLPFSPSPLCAAAIVQEA